MNDNNKKLLEKELIEISDKISNFNEQSELQLSTALFVAKEIENLEKRRIDNMSTEEKETLLKEAKGLQRKLQMEISEWDKRTKEVSLLEIRMDELDGLIENL